MFRITAYGVRKNEIDYFKKLNIFDYELNLITDNLKNQILLLQKALMASYYVPIMMVLNQYYGSYVLGVLSTCLHEQLVMIILT